MKKIVLIIITLLCGIVVAIILGEGIVRYFKLAPVMLDFNIIYDQVFVRNPKICYKMKPLANQEINSEGFRDKEFSLNKDTNLVRIIMLGDSITNGAFVKRSASFPEVLEKRLNAENKLLSSPVKYEVMNFSVGGYNIVSEIEVLRVYGLKYKPDIVILNYFYNDNEMYSIDYWHFLKRTDIGLAEKNWAYQYYLNPERFRWKRLFFRSHLFVYAWAYVNQLRESWLEFKNVEYKTYKENIVFEKLKELKKMAAEYNFKILICMHPILDYDKQGVHPNYLSTQKNAEELGIPCMNLLEYYKQQSNDPQVFWVREKDTAHPNALGHKLIAKRLMFELAKLGYIRLEN